MAPELFPLVIPLTTIFTLVFVVSAGKPFVTTTVSVFSLLQVGEVATPPEPVQLGVPRVSSGGKVNLIIVPAGILETGEVNAKV